MARKRKYVSTDNRDPPPSSPQRGIKDFANVRKAHQPEDCSKKRKTAHLCTLTTLPTPPEHSNVERKRKRHDELQEINGNIVESLPLSSPESSFAAPPNDARYPDCKRSKISHLPASQVTPSRKTAALFENLALGEKFTPIPFKLGSTVSKPREISSDDSTAPKSGLEWPEEFEELLQLNGAFLSALSLYYAHNGASSVNVGKLLRMITETWKVRKVSPDDIRMLLGVSQASQEEGFTLEDYGRGGIHMARSGPRGRAIKRNTGYIDEATLKNQFRASLQRQWREWVSSAASGGGDVRRFLQQLPLADITQHKSVETTASLFARGDQRLAGLKASQAASKAADSQGASAPSAKLTSDSESRGATLLDRILAKQSLALSLPKEPTKAQLERKAALQRVEGVARTLVLLAAGRSRCSFSLSAITQHLQQSLRSPISVDEAQTCLEIMAKEITPGFVSVAQNGSVKSVTVAKGCQVELVEIKRRIAIAGSTG